MTTPGLFTPLDLGAVTLRNRIAMSPMCQYQARGDGTPTTWHTVHYVARAIGGLGLVMTEMTDVTPNGRITDGCLGLWNAAQRDAFARIVDACHEHGAAVGVQLAHAGRKSTLAPDRGGDLVAPSAVPFAPDRPTPRALQVAEIEGIVEAFGRSAALAVEAGFDVIELHGAHGYLIHQFMSPSSNRRDDRYGERDRFALDVIREVRRHLPAGTPLVFRVSATETNPDGYEADEVLAMTGRFLDAGVDALDVTTGGNGPIRPEAYPGYQVRHAERYRRRFGVPVMAVGRLESPHLADAIVRDGRADVAMIGRGLLRNPYWPRDAADALGAEFTLPGVYEMGIAR